MAEQLNNQADFWLPPEFLTDDDILMDFKPKPKPKNRETDSVLHFPFDYSNSFNSLSTNSGLSSPVESLASSESEEEEYLAELTRKMANSSLLDDLWKTETHKNLGISVSPQSTLYGFKQESTRTSPNCPSPPSAVTADRKDASWDLLYAAAGEVARMRMMEEANSYYQNRLNRLAHPIDSNLNIGLQPSHPLTFQQLQIAKFQLLKREQLMRQQQQQLAFHVALPQVRTSERPPANLSPANWPTLQQSLKPPAQPASTGSGMRAVYLGNTGTRRDRAGTGVFIPRRAGAPEPRKSSGCSTVLLPDKVVQALNLNLKAMDDHSRLNNALTSDLDGAVNIRNNIFMSQQQNMNLRTSAVADLRLPQEWTY